MATRTRHLPDPRFDGARLAALRELGLLDSEPDEELDRYTRLATELLGVPISLVSLVEAGRQFFASHSGLSPEAAAARQTPLSHSFCQHAVASKQPLVVSDARAEPLVADNLAVRDLGVLAYAGMPLVLSDGHAVGAFCAIDEQPHEWSERELRILEDLAAAVTAHLEVRRSLSEQTLRDPVTGLPNRVLLAAQADRLLTEAGPSAAPSVGAIALGMDGFALVNEAYGAATGDLVLEAIGRRLATELRRGDMLGRLRGDHFAVVTPDIGDERAAIDMAGRLRAAVADEPLKVGDHSIGVTATAGLATGLPDGSGVDLLARADESVRGAKRNGGAVKRVSRTGRLAADRLRLRAGLAGALRRGEITVAYQPIVSLADGRPVAFEALARWEHPELGAVSPARFIPEAERSGDIVAIGESVLRTACAQVARWRRSRPELGVSVNLAPLQLELPNLVDVVESALADNGLPPEALVLELTESALVEPGAIESRNLSLLRELGVRVALDDFGTGYCSLAYVKEFPIDKLKIDRSFVRGVESERRDAVVVQAIVALAHGFEIDVVAEGIENAGQEQLLRLLGCGLGQGYLFAEPRPAEQIEI